MYRWKVQGHLGGFLSQFFNHPLTREVSPGIGNLTSLFSVVIFPFLMFYKVLLFYSLLVLHLFSDQNIRFIGEVIFTFVLPDP